MHKNALGNALGIPELAYSREAPECNGGYSNVMTTVYPAQRSYLEYQKKDKIVLQNLEAAELSAYHSR